jgi:thiol-disulfide isomerase/thioredoxin
VRQAATLVALAAVAIGQRAHGQGLIAVERRAPLPSPTVLVMSGPVAPVPDSMVVGVAPGEVAVIDFWAPWCVPCAGMHAQFSVLAGRLPAGVRVLSVAMASRPASVTAFLAEHGRPPYAVGLANGRARAAFGFTNVPVVVVVDRQGRVAWRRAGGFDPLTTLPPVIDQVLAERPPVPGGP